MEWGWGWVMAFPPVSLVFERWRMTGHHKSFYFSGKLLLVILKEWAIGGRPAGFVIPIPIESTYGGNFVNLVTSNMLTCWIGWAIPTYTCEPYMHDCLYICIFKPVNACGSSLYAKRRYGIRNSQSLPASVVVFRSMTLSVRLNCSTETGNFSSGMSIFHLGFQPRKTLLWAPQVTCLASILQRGRPQDHNMLHNYRW